MNRDSTNGSRTIENESTQDIRTKTSTVALILKDHGPCSQRPRLARVCALVKNLAALYSCCPPREKRLLFLHQMLNFQPSS